MPVSAIGFIVGFALSVAIIVWPNLWIRVSQGVLNMAAQDTQDALEELVEKYEWLTPGRVRIGAIIVAGIFGLMVILSL